MLDNLFPIDPEVAARIEALDLQFNKFGVDPYGIDKNDLTRFVSAFAWVYRYYLKVDVYGLDNVPSRGRGVLVGNHSGGVAIDGAMAMGSMLLDAEPPRLPHAMIDKFIHEFPGASKFMARTGQFTGNPDQAKRLLLEARPMLRDNITLPALGFRLPCSRPSQTVHRDQFSRRDSANLHFGGKP